tara:strand:+ start:1039 stop:1209 length:171 start_codon:yes stop_codon:yes gene_type:complete
MTQICDTNYFYQLAKYFYRVDYQCFTGIVLYLKNLATVIFVNESNGLQVFLVNLPQ